MYCGSSASSLSRNSGTPLRSSVEWNGTSMPGTSMNGGLPPYSGAAGRVGLQVFQAGDRAGDRVLLAGEVVVHDLQKLAGRLGDGLDVFLDVRVVDAELVRTQRAHAVVRAAWASRLDQVVHGGAAVEHQFQLGLQRDDVGERGQRVVLAERVLAKYAGQMSEPASRRRAVWA